MGEDDFDMPRILIEYSIIGGKFTNVMNNFDKIKNGINKNLYGEEAG